MLLFSDFSKKIGGIIKIIDGNGRALPPIAMKIFTFLKLLNKTEKKQLKKWDEQKLFNHSKKQTGSMVVKITL